MGWLNRFCRLGAKSPIEVTIYTRAGCHLCDDAREILQKSKSGRELAIREIDIDRDPELRERYDTIIPVVEIEGVERFRGRINQVLAKRLIRALD